MVNTLDRVATVIGMLYLRRRKLKDQKISNSDVSRHLSFVAHEKFVKGISVQKVLQPEPFPIHSIKLLRISMR
jgi:hypothetical protein